MKYINEQLIKTCLRLLFEGTLEDIEKVIKQHKGLQMLGISKAQWVLPNGNLALITPKISGNETRGQQITDNPTHRYTELDLSKDDPSPTHIEGRLPELLDFVVKMQLQHRNTSN